MARVRGVLLTQMRLQIRSRRLCHISGLLQTTNRRHLKGGHCDLSIPFAASSGNLPLRPGPSRQSATPILESFLEPVGLADSRLDSASTAKRAGAAANAGT